MSRLQPLLQDPITFLIVVCVLALLLLAAGFIGREIIFILQHRRTRGDRVKPRRGRPISRYEHALLGDCWYEKAYERKERRHGA